MKKMDRPPTTDSLIEKGSHDERKQVMFFDLDQWSKIFTEVGECNIFKNMSMRRNATRMRFPVDHYG